MTRKDYVLIADTIAGLVRDIAEEQFHARAHTDKAILSGERLGVHNLAQRLADQLPSVSHDCQHRSHAYAHSRAIVLLGRSAAFDPCDQAYHQKLTIETPSGVGHWLAACP